MTDKALIPVHDAGEIMERVIITGDLSKLTPIERVNYYNSVCASLGLNPLTKPFDYINLSGRLTLYATRTASDQLRGRDGISVDIVRSEINTDLGIYIVEVRATTPDGRRDFATGVVPLPKGPADAIANALMKAETKAKRRVTLSICGLGWIDETEIETVRQARPVVVDDDGVIQGEVIEPEPAHKSRPMNLADQQPNGQIYQYEDGSIVADRAVEWYLKYVEAHDGKAPANRHNLAAWFKKMTEPAAVTDEPIPFEAHGPSADAA